MEDVVSNALGGLSNNIGTKVSLDDLPLVRSVGRLMHQAGGGLGKAVGNRAPEG